MNARLLDRLSAPPAAPRELDLRAPGATPAACDHPTTRELDPPRTPGAGPAHPPSASPPSVHPVAPEGVREAA
eukprot:6209606-Pyramimonas_sp.AAC.1